MTAWCSALFAEFPPQSRRVLCDRSNSKKRRLQLILQNHPVWSAGNCARQWFMLLLIISLIATSGICNINFNTDRNSAQFLAGIPQQRALYSSSSISSSSISSSFSVRFAAAEEYVRCGTGAASLCRADYPICCNGFCASAGTKCCPSASTCDPGEECCTSYDPITRAPKPTCCKPGSFCGPRGCIDDTTCASITDIGVCVNQFASNSSVEQNNNKDVSRCSWCCESQRCIPTSEASARSICASPISSPNERCPDPCNLFGSCDECTMSKSSSSSSSSCTWDSSKQKCFSLGSSSYNPFAVVSSPSQCASVLFWGHGIYPSDGPMSIFEGSSKVFLIVFAVLFVTCLLAICVSGARVAILVNRTHMDWEAERETIAQSISAAVPRYGFGESEGTAAPASAAGAGTVHSRKTSEEKKKKNKKTSGNKKAKKSRGALPCERRSQEGLLSPTATPLLGREDSNDDASSNTDDEDDRDLCHLCSRPVKHDSRRRFIQVGCASLPSSSSSSSVAQLGNNNNGNSNNTNTTKKADAPSLGGGREEETGGKAEEKNGPSPASNKIKDNGEQKSKDKDKASSEGQKKASSAEVVEAWHQIILLPCYHRVCKMCILEMARQNAVTAAAKSEMDANSANGGRGLCSRFVFELKRCAVAIVTRIDGFWSRVFDSLTASVAGPPGSSPARRRRRRSRGGRDDNRQTSVPTASTPAAALSNPSSSSAATHRAPATSLPSSRGDERINTTTSLGVVESDNINSSGWASSGRGETCTSLHVMAMEEGRGGAPSLLRRSSAIDTGRIKAVLDAPNVAEDALLAIMRGSTVEAYERAASAAKASALRREQRRRQRDSDRARRRGTPATAGAHEEDETSSSSDDEESGDEKLMGTNERSPPHCPICSKSIELIFVPGKIIR